MLLPNGKVLVCNGAQRGVPGGTIDGGSTAKDAAFTALLYDPEAPAGNRITTLASSKIHRYYHSTAMLLPSGDVWVGGSEQGALSSPVPFTARAWKSGDPALFGSVLSFAPPPNLEPKNHTNKLNKLNKHNKPTK